MAKVISGLEQHRAATPARTRSLLHLASVKIDVIPSPWDFSAWLET